MEILHLYHLSFFSLVKQEAMEGHNTVQLRFKMLYVNVGSFLLDFILNNYLGRE